MKIITMYVTGTNNVILMDAFICLLVHLLIASTDVKAQAPGDESTACPIPSAMTSPHTYDQRQIVLMGTYNYLDLINPAVGVWQQVPLDGMNGSDTGIVNSGVGTGGAGGACAPPIYSETELHALYCNL